MQGLNEFGYLRDITKKYGNFYVLQEIHGFVDHISENKEQLTELITAYEMIDKKEDAYRISQWIHHCWEQRNRLGKDEVSFSLEVTRLLLLFGHLGEKNIPPFSSCRVAFIEKPPKKPNWENLPKELDYLIDVAEAYGPYDTEEDIWNLLDNAGPEDMAALAQAAERMRLNGHMEMIEEWIDRFPIEEHEEARLVWCLLWVISQAGVQSSDNEDWNTVEKHIESLGRFGSFRLASLRMFAAKNLAEFGKDAKTAILHLHRALEDNDMRVRIWAHYALARIEGDRDEHEGAVRRIFSQHDKKDDLDLIDEVGIEAEAVLGKFQELE